MSKQLNQIIPVGNFSIEDIETMRLTLAKDASPDQFNLFVRTAAAAGLNPFLNHIYCIVYGGKMSIQMSVEGIMFLAKRVEGYQGIDTQLVHENDEFEASIDKEGKWVIDQHVIKFPRGKVIACYSIAYREGFRPVTEFMEVDEVQHHLTGNNAANWKKYFNDFFKKTVAKRAAKRQYGIEVSEDDPIEGGGTNIPGYQPTERKDITHEANAAAASSASKQSQQQTQAPNDEEQIAELRTQIKSNFRKLGITDSDGRQQFYESNGVTFSTPETIAELEALVRKQELRISEKQAAADDELN